MDNSRDPRIRAFHRKAVAILMEQKGITPEGQVKLHRLADKLHLSPSEFADALVELGKNSITDDNFLSRYERSFMDFLRKEFSNLSDRILTLPVERRALERAKTKYLIGHVRARYLIEMICSELSIKTISRPDAESYVEQVIAEEIGQQSALPVEQVENWYRLAEGWGVDSEQVDVIVEQAQKENWRWSRRTRTARLIRAFWYMVALVGIFGGSLFWFLSLNSSSRLAIEPVEQSDHSYVTKLDTAWEFSHVPNANAFLSRHVDLQKFVEELAVTKGQERLRLFRDFVSQIVLLTDDDFVPATGIFTSILQMDPKTGAAWLDRTTVRSLIRPMPLDRLVGSVVKEGRAWQLIDETQRQYPEVRSTIFEIAREFPELNWMARFQDKVLLPGWYENQWRRAEALCQLNPNQGLQLAILLLNYPQFPQLAAWQDEVGNHLITGVLLANGDAVDWFLVQKELPRLISKAQSPPLERWLEIASRISNSDHRLEIQKLVAQRKNLAVTGLNDFELSQLLEAQKTELRSERLADLIRLNQAAELVEGKYMGSGWSANYEFDAIPDRLHVTMEVANQSLLAYVMNDQFLNGNAPDLTAETQKMAEWQAELQSIQKALLVKPSRPAAFPMEEVQSYLLRLEERDDTQADSRRIAFERLCQRLGDAKSLTYSDLARIVRYVVSKVELDERVAIEKNITALRGWPQFLLCLSDHLEEAEISPDELLSIVQQVTGLPLVIEVGEPWRDELTRVLKNQARDLLEIDFAPDLNSANTLWSALPTRLAGHYQVRCRLLKANPPAQSETVGLLKSFADCLPQQSRNFFEVRNDRSISSPRGELHEAIPFQEQALKGLWERLSQYTAADQGGRVPIPATNRLQEVSTLGEVFWRNEMAIQEVLSRLRAESFKQLLKTGGW